MVFCLIQHLFSFPLLTHLNFPFPLFFLSPSLSQVGGWTWWKHYEEAVERMLASDEEGLLSNKALSEAEKEAARKELSATRDHFASLLDRSRYEAGRARGERRLSYRALQAALLITLYHDEPILALPYRLLSTLLDIDENLTAWRHRHALMVHRMIGVKMGTGGSAGYHYLRASADRHKIFTDLFNLSTFLIPRHLMPPLPDDIRSKLAFAFVPSVPSTPAHPPRPGSAGSYASYMSMPGPAAGGGSSGVPTVSRTATAAVEAAAKAFAEAEHGGGGAAVPPAGHPDVTSAGGGKCPFGHGQ